jgi:hypothetical protein
MNELPFRVWAEVAAALTERNWNHDEHDNRSRVRELLAPLVTGTVLLRRAKDGTLRTDRVMLWSKEAKASAAYTKALFWPRPGEPLRVAEDVPVRIGDHLGDNKFVDAVDRRLHAWTPYDPAGLPDFPDWHWYEDRNNLLIIDGRLVLPPGWECRGMKIGPIFCRTTHVRLINGRGKMGLMSMDGTVTVPCRFAYLGDPDGWGRILACEAHEREIPLHSGQCDIVDAKGVRLNPDGIKVQPGTLRGYAIAFRENDRLGHVGLIASDGTIVGGIRWRTVGEFEYDRARVEDATTGLRGFLDRAGAVVIPPTFEKAYPFDRGFAAVSPKGANGRFGLIDPQGKLVVPAVWKDLTWFLGNHWHVTAEDGAIGLIDSQGRIAIDPYHPSPEEQAQIEKSYHYRRGHPFAIALGQRLRVRIEAALAGSDTLAPIAGLMTEASEFASSGLWSRSIALVVDHPTLRGMAKAGDTGFIGWSYPASASIFDFSVEAPVEGLKAWPHGTIGIPWKLLRLVEEKAEQPEGDSDAGA